MAATEACLAARAITDVTPESFSLRFADVADQETVLCKDVVAVVPAPPPAAADAAAADADGAPASLLLFLKSCWEAAPPAAGAAGGAFVTRLAARRVPRAVAAAAPLARFAVAARPAHLDLASGGRRLHVILSVQSGACEAESFFTHVVQPVLAHLGLSPAAAAGQPGYELHRTASERSILDLAANVLGPHANRGVPQTVLLLSGDGGAIDIINGISVVPRGPAYLPPVIGVLALGTGNALANSCGLNDDGTKGLASFLRGAPHALPTFRATFSPGTEILSNEGRTAQPIPARDARGVGTLYGVVVASWGVHAALVAESDTAAMRQHGADRFAMAARELLFPSDGSEPHLYHGRVTLRQRSGGGAAYNVNWERQSHVYFLATFVSKLEKTLTISPRSRPLDGQLRILHFGQLPAPDIMAIFGLAYEGGKHTELDVVGYEAVEGFRIDFLESEARWRRVCVDGKIVRVGNAGWVDVSKVEEAMVELVVDL